MDRILNGLIQKAKRDAESLPYQIQPGGKGVRIWKHLGEGIWITIGELPSREDAEDYLIGKLSQVER